MLLATMREKPRSRGERVDVDRRSWCRQSRREPSGSASASSRAPREPREVAAQRRDVREEEMRDQHRLRRPEVRERRHQRVAGRCAPGRRARRSTARDRALQQRNAAAQVEPQIERHLLVARSAGVQPAAGVADPLDQLALDEAVHVLVVARRRTPDRRAPASRIVGQRRLDLLARRRRVSTPASCERPRPREAAGDVVFEQPAIEAERGAEVEGRGVGRRVEAAGPEISHQSSVVSRQSLALAFASGDRLARRRDRARRRRAQAPSNSFRRTTPRHLPLHGVGVARRASRRAGVNHAPDSQHAQVRPRATRGDENLPRLRRRARLSRARRARRATRSRRPTPCAPAMMPRLPSRSSSGMVTPLMPTGAPRSNAMSTSAGSPAVVERCVTRAAPTARSPRPLNVDRQRHGAARARSRAAASCGHAPLARPGRAPVSAGSRRADGAIERRRGRRPDRRARRSSPARCRRSRPASARSAGAPAPRRPATARRGSPAFSARTM